MMVSLSVCLHGFYPMAGCDWFECCGFICMFGCISPLWLECPADSMVVLFEFVPGSYVYSVVNRHRSTNTYKPCSPPHRTKDSQAYLRLRP